jgi:uncharacterized membrane protein
MNDKQLALLLTCFPGAKAASSSRRSLAARLKAQDDDVLQTTVLRVNAKHRASVHDPQRVLRGTLTSALTWGAFGLVAGTNKVESAIIWAVLGAICGGLYAYTSEHLLSKDEITRLGQALPASSSALVTYVRTDDAKRLLEASEPGSPSTASAATISSELEARVYAGSTMPVELPHGSPGGRTPTNEISLLNMILVRYPDATTARQLAAKASKDGTLAKSGPQLELVVETRPDGRRRVADPAEGVAAMSRSDVISWGAFGLVFGAIAGLVGGGGILGFLKAGVATGVGWAVFGLIAGALYGLWAGRSISARRLNGIGEILPAGSSALLAWADGPLRDETLTALDGPGARRLVLCFNPIDGGAVLEAV